MCSQLKRHVDSWSSFVILRSIPESDMNERTSSIIIHTKTTRGRGYYQPTVTSGKQRQTTISGSPCRAIWCVCVCVFVCEGKRVRESVRVCVHVRVRAYVFVFMSLCVLAWIIMLPVHRKDLICEHNVQQTSRHLFTQSIWFANASFGIHHVTCSHKVFYLRMHSSVYITLPVHTKYFICECIVWYTSH